MTISVKNLKKYYRGGQKTIALNNISYVFNNKNTYGIVGSNGAGKTSFFMCLCGFVDYNGLITYEGEPLSDYLSQNNKSIALVTNKMKLDEEFSLDYNVSFFGQLNDMSKDEIETNKKRLYNLFNLEAYAKREINTLSTGLKQKALLSVMLLNNPDIIIFDEPLSNIDYVAQNSLIEIIKILKKEGKLILISSHIPGIIEQVCTEILIFEQGKISTVLNKNEVSRLDMYYKEKLIGKNYEKK